MAKQHGMSWISKRKALSVFLLCTTFFTHANIICVSNTSELFQAINQAKLHDGATTILLAPGDYHIKNTINVTRQKLTIASVSGNPSDTIIHGIGMKPTKNVNNLIRVAANDFSLRGITLRETPNHLVQVAGELGISNPVFERVIFENSYEHMLKVSYGDAEQAGAGSFGGIVRHAIFQYTKQTAPNYYTGGVDAIGARDWLITDSVFRNIASPAKRVAQHAVHFWTNAEHNKVTHNVFINNDRAIGFGMINGAKQKGRLSHRGGEITGNIIYHEDNDSPYADVGIILEATAGSKIANNWIFMEHHYPNAIEYRFRETVNTMISGNITNRTIRSRNGGSARLIDNSLEVQKQMFKKMLELRVNEIEKILLDGDYFRVNTCR